MSRRRSTAVETCCSKHCGPLPPCLNCMCLLGLFSGACYLSSSAPNYKKEREVFHPTELPSVNWLKNPSWLTRQSFGTALVSSKALRRSSASGNRPRWLMPHRLCPIRPEPEGCVDEWGLSSLVRRPGRLLRRFSWNSTSFKDRESHEADWSVWCVCQWTAGVEKCPSLTSSACMAFQKLWAINTWS